MNDLIQQIAILAPPFLLAITFHEVCHGYVAYRLGDPTARDQGRLTLNPLKHLDLLGVIAFIIIKIGWAKPVPVNPAYFRDPDKGMLYVSLAGPGSNFVLAVASSIAARLFLPVAGLLPQAVASPLLQMLAASVWINIVLGIFNLVPIPPLDGSKIVMGLLPRELADAYRKLEPFGFVLLLLLFYTGIIGRVIRPLIDLAYSLIGV